MQSPAMDRLRRNRFSVVCLLATIVGIALLIVLLQLRRRSVWQQEQSLRTDGVQFYVDRQWQDELWTSWPNNAIISVSKWQGRYKIGQALFELKEAKARIRTLQERLKKLGVENVSIRYHAKNVSWKQFLLAEELKQFR